MRNSDTPSKIVWSVIYSEHTCGERFGHPEIYLRNNGIVVSNSREMRTFSITFLNVGKPNYSRNSTKTWLQDFK